MGAVVGVMVLLSTPLVAAQADPDPTYATRDGPRTALQLQADLAAAGYGGPWDAASMVAAYDRAGLAAIDPYPSDAVWSCFATNPSCSREPWWGEWDALQDATHVSYAAVGTHFTTERSFAEAVDLLWQWPEGKLLLRQADQASVLVMSLDYDQQVAFATYSPQRKLIALNRRFTAAPTWMVADVLAHELSHASDDAHGVNMAPTFAGCIAGETAATAVQQRFLVWLTRTSGRKGCHRSRW
jgi:hypothetical protein